MKMDAMRLPLAILALVFISSCQGADVTQQLQAAQNQIKALEGQVNTLNTDLQQYKDLLKSSQDNYNLLFNNFTSYRATQEKQTKQLLNRITGRISLYERLQNASYNVERKYHALFLENNQCMANLTLYIQRVNQQQQDIDALNIEIDALLAKLAACQKSKGQSGIDCDKKLKDCQDGASKKLGVCKSEKKRCQGDLHNEKTKSSQSYNDRTKCAGDLKKSQDSLRNCENEKNKQKGDINALNKAVQQSKDDLNKCQQSKATCEKGRAVEGGNLKQCQDNHRNCQSRVNDLTKIVDNGKKVKVAHDQCKAKLEKLEQDRLKNTALKNCAAWKAQGMPSGDYLIDPDGSGVGVAQFRVYCRFTGQKIETLVKNSSPAQFSSKRGSSKCEDLKHYGDDKTPWTNSKKGSKNKSKKSGKSGETSTKKGYCQAVEYTYSATDDQMTALKAVSTSCTQRITWKCYDQSVLTVFTQDGYYWGKHHEWWPYYNFYAPNSPLECECAEHSACLNNKGCNCYNDDTNWQQDSILLKDKKLIPVRKIALGDLDQSSEQAQISVGDLVCV